MQFIIRGKVIELSESVKQEIIQKIFDIYVNEETTGDLPTLQDEPRKKKNTVMIDRMPNKLGRTKFKIYKYI